MRWITEQSVSYSWPRQKVSLMKTIRQLVMLRKYLGSLSYKNPSWGPNSLLYKGYWVSFPGINQPGHGVKHPHPFRDEVKERTELYLYSPSGPSGPVLGRIFRLTYTNIVLIFQLHFDKSNSAREAGPFLRLRVDNWGWKAKKLLSDTQWSCECFK